MDLSLHVEDPLILGFCRKVGQDRIRNLMMDFLRTYAETCSGSENLIESAIIESRKDICSQLLTRMDLEDVVSKQLSRISTTRDLDNLKSELMRTVESNTKTLEMIKSNLLLEFDRIVKSETQDIWTPIKNLMVLEFNKLSVMGVDKSDINDLGNRIMGEMTRLGVDRNDLNEFRRVLLNEMTGVVMKTDVPVDEIRKLGKIQEDIGALSDMFSKHSQKKGEIAENVFERLLHKSFPVAEIERTTGKSNAGDFILGFDEKRFLIDVKNYTNNVPIKEIEKLKRDVVENKADVGVMVSVGSGISSVERIGIRMAGKIPIVLLPNNNMDMEMIKFAINLGLGMKIPDSSIDKGQFDGMIKDVREILTEFDKSIESIRKTRDRVLSRLDMKVEVDENPKGFNCVHCKKPFKTKAGKISHERSKH